MLEELNRLAKEEKLIVECSNGEEFPIEKVYSVSGRASAIKILVGDEGKTNKLLDKIDDLEHDLKVSEEEKETAEFNLEKAGENHEEYLQKIDSAIESAEFNLGIDTSSRHSYDRINELARKIYQKFESLEEEREFFKEKIRELETWKENTLKDE
jgi:DNA repair ATPase RecN